MPSVRARLRPLAILAIAMLSVVCGGCVYIPLSETKLLGGKHVTDEKRRAIQPAITTRSEVLTALGPPDVEWEDERICAYSWQMRQGLLLYAVAGGYGAGVGAMEVPKGYILLVQFDETDRVRRVERLPDRALQSFGKQVRRWAAAGATKP